VSGPLAVPMRNWLPWTSARVEAGQANVDSVGKLNRVHLERDGMEVASVAAELCVDLVRRQGPHAACQGIDDDVVSLFLSR